MCLEIRKIPEGAGFFEKTLCLKDNLEGIEVKVLIDTKRDQERIECLTSYFTKIPQECARCLENFDLGINEAAKFYLVPEGRTPPNDDSDCYFYKGEAASVDFTQTIYEEILMHIPLKPLCKEDCAGIEY